MFITLQIPFVDLRLLRADRDPNCFFPHTWVSGPGYYRHFGARHGRTDCEELPPPEHTFFQAKRMLTSLRHETLNTRLVYARLFADRFFFHFDIGIKVFEYGAAQKPLPLLQDLWKHGRLHAPSLKQKQISLNEHSLWPYIKDLYLYATTYVKAYPSPVSEKPELYFGRAAVFCQCSLQPGPEKGFRKIHTLDNRLTLYQGSLPLPRFSMPVWLMQKHNDGGVTKDKLRKLRICLLKLHNYREGLTGVFRFLDAQIGAPETLNLDELRVEFKYLMRLLRRESLYGVPGKRIMDYALDGEKYAHRENWEELLSNLEEYYDRIKELQHGGGYTMKVDFHDQVTVQGDQIFAENIYHTAEDKRQMMDFAAAFDAMVQQIVETEVANRLTSQKDELMQYLQNKEKNGKKISRIWDSMKNTLKAAVQNADKLTTLFLLGEKIVNPQ